MTSPAARSPIDLLARAGAALYGERWQVPLARALGYSGRSVRYWASGARPVPPVVWDALRVLVLERLDTLDRLLADCGGCPD